MEREGQAGANAGGGGQSGACVDGQSDQGGRQPDRITVAGGGRGWRRAAAEQDRAMARGLEVVGWSSSSWRYGNGEGRSSGCWKVDGDGVRSDAHVKK